MVSGKKPFVDYINDVKKPKKKPKVEPIVTTSFGKKVKGVKVNTEF